MPNTFVDQLMEAKRKAALAGRPVSQQEVAGAAQGYFADAAQRNLQGKQIALAEQQQKQNQEQFAASLLQRQAEMAAQQKAARRAYNMGWANTGLNAGLAGGMLYYM